MLPGQSQWCTAEGTNTTTQVPTEQQKSFRSIFLLSFLSLSLLSVFNSSFLHSLFFSVTSSVMLSLFSNEIFISPSFCGIGPLPK
jgi:hypothetical protein